MLTNAPMPPAKEQAEASAELTRLLFDGDYERAHRNIAEVLLDPLFDPRAGLTADDAGRLAYTRSRAVHRRVQSPRALIGDPGRLFALAEWPSLLDVSTFSLLMVHYNLCVGTVVEHGADRPDLEDLTEELDSMASFGVYMATELGYGNNVAALRTEAAYEPETESFILNTPDALAQKYMSYSGFPEIPKIAVVMARLKTAAKDNGVFPFLVRISKNGELRAGIRTTPCPEKPVQGLDNGLTWFDHVRIPRSALLHGALGSFDAEGAFRPAIANQRTQFLRAMNRIQSGRLCVSSAACGAGRAAVYIALRYAARRLTNAPGRGQVPIIAYRSHQLPVFTSLARAYAMTFLLNLAKREYLGQSESGLASSDVGTLIAVTKALSTWEMTDVVAECRERCGAQGMFSVNRIADFASLLQGLVTAEGDNLVLLSTAAAHLLTAEGDKPAPGEPDPGETDADLSPRRCAALLRHREGFLRRTARTAMNAADTTYFDSWNSASNSALAMVRTRGARLALESLSQGLDESREPTCTRALGLLARLYGLTEISKDGSWYALRGLIPAHVADDLPTAIDRLCESLAPFAELLTSAFQLSPELLRAPIAADDYVTAFMQAAEARS